MDTVNANRQTPSAYRCFCVTGQLIPRICKSLLFC